MTRNFPRALIATFISIFIAISAKPVVAQNITAPNFWDPSVRYPKPDTSKLPRLKFLTTTDFPPFNFVDRKKRLSGFNIDLARQICVELEILQRCQIQALPWAELEKAIENGEGEAIIAGLSISRKNRAKYNFTQAYLKIPGRFISKRDAGLTSPMFLSLAQKKVGVIAGSSHQKYFQTAFHQRHSQSFPTRQAAFNALKEGRVDAIFTDALSATFWLVSKDAADCCNFAGDAFLSDQYFGSGLSIATKKSDKDLANGLNYALKRINDNGKFLELYLRYFPLGLY